MSDGLHHSTSQVLPLSGPRFGLASLRGPLALQPPATCGTLLCMTHATRATEYALSSLANATTEHRDKLYSMIGMALDEGITQRRIAELTGLHRNTIRNIKEARQSEHQRESA